MIRILQRKAQEILTKSQRTAERWLEVIGSIVVLALWER